MTKDELIERWEAALHARQKDLDWLEKMQAENKILRVALKSCATELLEVYVAEHETFDVTPEEIKTWLREYFDIAEGGKNGEIKSS